MRRDARQPPAYLRLPSRRSGLQGRSSGGMGLATPTRPCRPEPTTGWGLSYRGFRRRGPPSKRPLSHGPGSSKRRLGPGRANAGRNRPDAGHPENRAHDARRLRTGREQRRHLRIGRYEMLELVAINPRVRHPSAQPRKPARQQVRRTRHPRAPTHHAPLHHAASRSRQRAGFGARRQPRELSAQPAQVVEDQNDERPCRAIPGDELRHRVAQRVDDRGEPAGSGGSRDRDRHIRT